MAGFLKNLLGGGEADKAPEPPKGPIAPPAKSETISLPEKADEGPKLTLKKVMESSEPILRTGDSAESLIAIDGYTVVQGPHQLYVVDDRGNVDQDFSNKSKTQISVNWDEVAKDQQTRPRFSTFSTGIQAMPSLRAVKKTMIGSSGEEDLSGRHTNVQLHGKLQALNGGDQIVLSQDGHTYIAFETTRDGERLQPRMWNRLEGAVPKLLENSEVRRHLAFTRIFEEDNGHVVHLTKYHVEITREGVTIRLRSGGRTETVFSDPVESVELNVCADPVQPDVLYYCRSDNPKEVSRIDTSVDPNEWHTQRPLKFPNGVKFRKVSDLKMDPSGRFFTCVADRKFVILAADTLEPVETGIVDMVKTSEDSKQTNDASTSSKPTKDILLSQATLDKDGRIRAVNAEGKVVVYETNLDTIGHEIESRKAAKLASGIDVSGLFGSPSKPVRGKAVEKDAQKALEPTKTQIESEFGPRIAAVQTDEDMRGVADARNTLKERLKTTGLNPTQIEFVTGGVDAKIAERMREIGDSTVGKILNEVRAKIANGVSLSIIGAVSDKLTEAKNLEHHISPNVRDEVTSVSEEFQRKSQDIFRSASAEIEREVDGFVTNARGQLEKMDRQSQFDHWYDFELPRLKSMLGETARHCPAECVDALQHITQARQRLQTLAMEYEEKFRSKFEDIRERAATQTQELVDTLKHEITGMIGRMRGRTFASRDAAEAFIESNPAYDQLRQDIVLLGERNTDASTELLRTLETQIANFLFDVERGGKKATSEDGRQMEMFGSTPFPIFEAPVAKTQPKKTELEFIPEEKSRNVARSADELVGDIGVRITNSHGKVQTVRLWEGRNDENLLRNGFSSEFGEQIRPSYLPGKEFREFQKNHRSWKQHKGGLKEEYEKLRSDRKAHYKLRKPIGERGAEDETWKDEHRRMLEAFATFCSEKHIRLLQRLQHIEKAPDPEYANGSGLVPEWQNHWIVAPEDEQMLEQMAKFFAMQSKLQEGMLNLKGHAGTGKDVYMKMFAERTHRPYFTFDCTKWTTEADLSADIVLESKNGASQTVELPSAVVTAIQTPGAILYFNEWNAMPEPAQIFLHSLLDEKRSMTLKTRSGQVVKAQPSILIASSMNPGYAGTTAPQMATRSRIVDLEVGYPPLQRTPDAGDANPEKPYSVSEALKIARGVESLESGTRDRNMKRNKFVQWWDAEINGIGTAPNLTAAQSFDLKATFMLVQLSDRLRTEFIKATEGTRDEKKNGLVHAPITLREMRRCAYMLGEMTDQEKAVADPEQVAKNLVETFFLSHFDNREEREKTKTAMTAWSLKQKRLAA